MVPHVPRPHLNVTQKKYAYTVRVHSLEMIKTLPAAGGIAVLWTRGSKTAMTSEKSLASSASAVYEQELSLICTLFEEAKGGFTEKLCTFAARA